MNHDIRIPFERARELAAKFKILDVLFPLFADEPSIYLCSPPIGGAAQLDSNEMMPSSNVNVNAAAVAAAVNKCNMVSSPLPAFNRSDEYNHSGGASPAGIPNWDRPSYNSASFPPSHYDDHHHPQQQQTGESKPKNWSVCWSLCVFIQVFLYCSLTQGKLTWFEFGQ